MQEHDLLQQELNRSSNEHSLLQQINKWEKDSIIKIQVAAEAVRVDLREMIEKSKKQLSKACYEIAVSLRSSREADDFSEKDLNRWMQQLNELKLETTSPSSVQLIEDERSVIHLIKIRAKSTTNTNVASNQNNISLNYPLTQERFLKVTGPAKIKEEGLLAKFNSETDMNFAYIFGQQYYSQGRQTVRFQIEQSSTPYNIFFGCTSSRTIKSEIRLYSSSIIGWFGYNQVCQHGFVNSNSEAHGYNSHEIVTNDVLYLTFNCEKRQLELFHERTNKRHLVTVNMDEAPFPWQLLLVLTNINDCVRILP
jgi:hypothetical protein